MRIKYLRFDRLAAPDDTGTSFHHNHPG